MSRIDDLRALHEAAPCWCGCPRSDHDDLTACRHPDVPLQHHCEGFRLDVENADNFCEAADEEWPALLDVASAAEALIAAADHHAEVFSAPKRPLSIGAAGIRRDDAFATLRAALDRLQASTHDASGGPPAPHRRPSEDPT